MNGGIHLLMKNTNDFGIRLESLCRERGIRAKELARRLSISSSTLSEWMGRSGRLPRNPEHLKKLAEFFSVSLEYLLFGQEQADATIETLFQKSEIHSGLYEITIRKVTAKSSGGKNEK